jgi:hypothetical protein
MLEGSSEFSHSLDPKLTLRRRARIPQLTSYGYADTPMKTWPRVSTIVKAWCALTLVGIACLVWIIRQGPPDEEVIFRDFTGQLMLATMEVGIPSFGGLLLFLLFDSLVKRYFFR